MKKEKTPKQLLDENEELRIRLQEAEDTLQAIRECAVDAVVVSGPEGEKIFTLAGEEQIYRRLVETMGEGGLTTTPEGKILFCNRQLSDMLGLPMQEIVGKDLERFVKKSNRREMAALLAKAQLEPLRRRLVFLAANGTLVPAWVSANLLEHGDSVSICLVAMDQTELEASKEAMRQITEQREELRAQNEALLRSQAELHRLNRMLRAISNSNQAIMYAADEQQILQNSCRIIVNDCGYSMVWIGLVEDDEAESVRPAAFSGFEEAYFETMKITRADTPQGLCPTGTAIRTGKPCICRDMLTDPAFKPWRKEAIKRGYASSIALPLSADGRVFGSVTIYSKDPDPFSQDEVNLLTELASGLSYGITAIRSRVERNRAEKQLKESAEELKRSNSDLEQFAYVASHDLHEPLRAINGFLDLLRRRYKDTLDEKANEYIDYAANGAKRMDDLLTGLLEYSRVQTHGKPRLAVSAQAALNAAVVNLGSSIAESNAAITSDTLPSVNADGVQFTQLLQNLIHNAVKFRTNQRPEIHVGCKRQGNCWVFSVRDNGIGIDPQYAERIFLIFQRLHNREEYPGTGIGLSICKKIVKRHNGKIWVESKPGNGSTFYFTIPDKGDPFE